MHHISTPNAAAPLGHYSQGTRHGDVVYVSGQLPITPDGSFELGDIQDQTRVALENVKAVLEAGGSSLEKTLKVTIYISDINLWADANSVYADFFGNARPARAAVPVGNLPKGFLIEIEAIGSV